MVGFLSLFEYFKNILLPDINGQIIERAREETKIHNEAKYSVRA